MPKGRVLGIDWHRDQYGHQTRVKSLWAPVGTTALLWCTHSFEGKTVYDAKNHKTEYEGEDRLQSISQYSGRAPSNYSFYTKEKFFWSKDGKLQSNCLENSVGKVLLSTKYAYDSQGNVLKETFSGHLIEPFVKSYTYSNNRFNLLMSESDGKKTINYRYVPEKDLVERKFTKDSNGNIQKREFYVYDRNNCLITKQIDDGSSEEPQILTNLTCQLETTIVPKSSAPCFGFPKRILEKYFNPQDNSHTLRYYSDHEYYNEGYLKSLTKYDNKEEKYSTSSWKYNPLGLVTLETNPLNQTSEKKYDDNGNCEFERGPRKDFHKTHGYDFSNRLIRTEEHFVTKDGIQESLVTTFTYDRLSNKTSSTDPFGIKTEYSYDEFSRLTLIKLTEIEDENGVISNPIIQKTYDELGNVTSETNPRNFTTYTQYNAYGKPTRIDYPMAHRKLHL